jgi:hypothetical protein
MIPHCKKTVQQLLLYYCINTTTVLLLLLLYYCITTVIAVINQFFIFLNLQLIVRSTRTLIRTRSADFNLIYCRFQICVIITTMFRSHFILMRLQFSIGHISFSCPATHHKSFQQQEITLLFSQQDLKQNK